MSTKSTMSATTDDSPTISRHQPARAARRWFGGGVLAVATAAVVSALVIAADTGTSADHVLVPEGRDDSVVTELDVRGIPTWWSRQGGTTRQSDATELDVHGVPTWWSGRAPATERRSPSHQ